MIAALWARFSGWAAGAGIILLAIGVALLKGRAEGKRVAEAAQQKRADKLQGHYDEIDQKLVTPPDAYAHLRKRLHDDK